MYLTVSVITLRVEIGAATRDSVRIKPKAVGRPVHQACGDFVGHGVCRETLGQYLLEYRLGKICTIRQRKLTAHGTLPSYDTPGLSPDR